MNVIFSLEIMKFLFKGFLHMMYWLIQNIFS